MGNISALVEKEMELFQKEEVLAEIKKKFSALRKLLSLDHPFFADAIDKVYHATINHLSAVVEEQERHNRLLE